jgi:hypothetical protein
MRLRSVGGACVLAIASLVLSGTSVPAAERPPGFDDQVACGLPGDRLAEVDVLDRLDRLREAAGLTRLERSCRLSTLAATWLTTKPADDTFDPEPPFESLCDVDWVKLTLVVRKAATVDEAWDRILTKGNDQTSLLDESMKTVGVSVRVSDGKTWVHFFSMAPMVRDDAESFAPDLPSMDELMAQLLAQDPLDVATRVPVPKCDVAPPVPRPVWD